MEARIVESQPDNWNAVAPNPMVSWEWGEARKVMGIDVLRIGLYNGEILQDTFQITFHKLPKVSHTIGYMPRTRIPSQQVLDLLKQEAKKRKTVFVKIEPYVTTEEADKNEPFFQHVRLSNHSLFPQWTQMLDLTQSEEYLLKNMKSKWRYNIRLAKKRGVEVKEMTTPEGFDMFADLYFATTGRQKYAGHTRSYHKTIFETLSVAGMSRILIAFYKGEPLSAYHLFHFNDRLYYPYGGSSEKYREVMASNLLMWEAIRLGQKLKAEKFDMWGSLGPDYDRSAGGWAGFTRFKEGFGTEFVEFVGGYDFVLQPALYQVYNVAHFLRSKLLL